MDMALVFNVIQQYVRAGSPVQSSMHAVIAACENVRPHADWSRLRSLPYDDLSELREWILRPFVLEPPPGTIAGLWFGLFNPIYDGNPVADLYVCGSNRFEPSES